MREKREGFEMGGLFWMYTISMLICWVPVFGGFVAGFVGGWKAGRMKAALTNSFFTAIVFSIVLCIGALAFQGHSLTLIHLLCSPMFAVYSYALFLMVGALLGGFSRQLYVS